MTKILALGILLGAVTSLAGNTQPALAHVCTQSVEVEVGETFSVNIGVAAEDKPVHLVRIGVPKGFVLEDNFGFLGWVGEERNGYVEFTQGQISPYECAYFTLKGVIPKKGTYIAEITTIATDGTRKDYVSRNPYSPVPAMSMYAGVPMPDPQAFADGGAESGGPDVVKLGLFAAVVAAAGVVIAMRVNARRGAGV